MAQKSFGERMGQIEPPKLLGKDEITDAIRNKIYNFYKKYEVTPPSNISPNCEYVSSTKGVITGHNIIQMEVEEKINKVLFNYYHNHLKEIFEIDAYNNEEQFDFLLAKEDNFLNYCQLLEYLIEQFPSFADECNKIFEEEKFYYRFVNGLLEPITNETEIETVEEACETPLAGVQKHMDAALKCLSAKPEPDYRNTANEAFEAFECIAKDAAKVTPEKKISKALEMLRTKFALNSNIEKIMQKLAIYRNKNTGHAHDGDEIKQLTHAEAKFILITCSASVNYLKEKYYTQN